MANISDYKFHQLSDPRMDSVYINETEVENKELNKYLLTNFSNPHSSNIALSNHLNYFSGSLISQDSSSNNKNIGASNNLIFTTKNTHPENKLSLREREYLTIPYLGRGKVNVDTENDIMIGEEHELNKKSLNPYSEENYAKYTQYPLLPHIKNKVSNPKYLVEDMNDGWVRGGAPSREMNRDQCNKN